ncbi:LysM peptidoglycan-binding domain-containing protein [Longibacter sp.]|uniref:LysM peptidoglycan-binding domain-containing protein n=1 Tax=Longibacter sp. TaxID=2045415 RepID=UPI003EBB1175
MSFPPFAVTVCLLLAFLAGCEFESDTLEPPPAPDPETALSAPEPTSQAADAERVQPAKMINASTRSLEQRLSDASAEARVVQALAKQDDLRLFDFDATVRSGRLTLSGDVNTTDQHRLIDRVLARTRGLRAVTNRVTVAGRSPEAARGMIAEADAEQAAKGSYYTVRSGDTLWKIARSHRASVERIKNLNEIRGSSLQPGQRIRVR